MGEAAHTLMHEARADRSVQNRSSALFKPLTIANGTITLKHRVIMSPMTRNRGIPENELSTPDNQNRVWLADALMAEYYSQRASDGGLIITESILPCEGSGGMPGVPGLWLAEQIEGWKLVSCKRFLCVKQLY